MKEILICIEEALEQYSARQTDTPIRTVLPFGEGNSSIVMPSAAPLLGAMGLKYVTVVPSNAGRGKKVIQGVVCLADMETGEPLALLEGSYLTKLRTGALSGVATDHLARRDAKTLGIIGTGEQADGLCAAVFAVRDIETVYLFNRTAGKAARFAEKIAAETGKRVVICTNPGTVVKASDILVTATSSLEPVFTALLKHGTHVNAVGSFRPDMQELPSSAIRSASKVVVECAEAALAEAGDLCIPIRDGHFSPDDLHGELGLIISGRLSGRESEEEITVFKSVGLAIADVVVAKHLYDKALAAGIGTAIDLT
ncbi:delta(1)-pyrroline-2-carboxylate reductase [Sporosarcina sp. NCCP-2716]|nr:delta(1)-pyrroline-2-carboxylate reductase [Sporosarcina sp. NCCP-2716]